MTLTVMDLLNAANVITTDLRHEIAIFCPWCDDRTSDRPAGRYNPFKDLYHCFQCGIGGNVETLGRKVLERLNDEEAREWLQRLSNLMLMKHGVSGTLNITGAKSGYGSPLPSWLLEASSTRVSRDSS